MARIRRTGAWLSVLPSTAYGTELGAQEWRYSLFLSYGTNTTDLPDHCDECRASFDIYHALDCNKGGLIKARQNEIRDGVVEFASKAFTPMQVRDDPKIYTDCAVRGEKDKLKGYPSKEEGELKGDLLIRDL